MLEFLSSSYVTIIAGARVDCQRVKRLCMLNGLHKQDVRQSALGPEFIELTISLIIICQNKLVFNQKAWLQTDVFI